MKKILAMFIVSALAAVIVSGCGNKDEGAATDTTGTTATTGTTTTGGETTGTTTGG